MEFNIGDLFFTPTKLTLWLGIIAFVVVTTLCAIAVYRSSRRIRTGLLELLRLVCAVIVILLLWAPEFRKITPPVDQPTIAILYDGSYSTQTVDADVAKIFGNVEGKKLISRAEWIKLALDDKLWAPIEKNGNGTKIKKLAFSVDDPKRKSNKTGSNYYDSIDELLKNNDNLKAIVVIGDGDWNTGDEPSAVAQKAQQRNVPIYTMPVGRDSYIPDLEITSLAAPKFGIVSEAIQIPFKIRSSMKKDRRTSVTLFDKVSGKSVSKSITIPANEFYDGSILWKLDAEREYQFEFKVTPLPQELLKENNVQTFSLDAKKENIKVLVIETTPRWEYRFIRNALSRDPGVDLDCLLLHPKLGKGDGPDYIQSFPSDLAELQKYDVVFLGDVGVKPNQLTAEQADLLAGLVKNQASGIVFIPGSQGNIFSMLEKHPDDGTRHVTDLANLIPVELDFNNKDGFSQRDPISLSLTESGKGSLLTMLGDSGEENAQIWKKLPGFNWFAPVTRAKVGSEVLARHSSKRIANNQRMPMLVTQPAGTGKVLFLGHDSAWKWRRGVEDLYHYRFWGQVARWMSYKRNRAAGDNLRLHFSVEKPKPGDTVTIRANAFDKNGAPLQQGAVEIDITYPSGKKKNISLKREDGDWGAFVTHLTIDEPGQWKLSAYSTDQPDKKLETSIDTLQTEIEKIGQPARPKTLKEMANISNGKMITADDIPSLTDIINKMPEREPEVKATTIWNSWKLMAGIIALLSIFWMGRKLNGSF